MSSSIDLEDSGSEELQKWFRAETWLRGWAVCPDASIDRKRFQETYFSRITLWNKAFDFLANEDLDKVEAGVLKLDGDDLFVVVQEYLTRDEQDTRYEAHRRYADIQHVVSGSERISITNLGKTKEIVPYNDAADIVFLKASGDQYRLADNRNFFIFLPDDAHRPCVKDGISAPVRKIVVKVRIA